MYSILVADDEKDVVELLKDYFELGGYCVYTAYNGPQAIEAAAKSPDLILLDVMLPGDDGLTVLKKLRDDPAAAKIPVMIISAKTTELDRVKGLDLGADDYMCKPFSVMEMISRVKARLRGVQNNKDEKISFENITMSEDTRTVTAGGVPVELTYKEYELLKMFLANPKIVLRRDDILDRIWGHDSSGRTLDVHIRTLRAKLGEYGRYIITVRNVGYKLDKDE